MTTVNEFDSHRLVSMFEAMEMSDDELKKFLNNDPKKVGAILKNYVNPNPIYGIHTRPNLVIETFAFEYDIDENELRYSKKHDAAKIRDIVIFCFKKYLGLSRKQIGRFFKLKEAGVKKAINRVQKRINTDKNFRCDLNQLKIEISYI